jgi:hypothetical protein
MIYNQMSGATVPWNQGRRSPWLMVRIAPRMVKSMR